MTENYIYLGVYYYTRGGRGRNPAPASGGIRTTNAEEYRSEIRLTGRIERFPSTLKGVKEPILIVRTVEGERVSVAIPKSYEMDFFMSISGYYRASYNSDEDGPLFDGKSKTELPGPAPERRKALREKIYGRFGNRDGARDRTFIVREAPDGKLFLYRSYIAR